MGPSNYHVQYKWNEYTPGLKTNLNTMEPCKDRRRLWHATAVENVEAIMQSKKLILGKNGG